MRRRRRQKIRRMLSGALLRYRARVLDEPAGPPRSQASRSGSWWPV